MAATLALTYMVIGVKTKIIIIVIQAILLGLTFFALSTLKKMFPSEEELIKRRVKLASNIIASLGKIPSEVRRVISHIYDVEASLNRFDETPSIETLLALRQDIKKLLDEIKGLSTTATIKMLPEIDRIIKICSQIEDAANKLEVSKFSIKNKINIRKINKLINELIARVTII